MQNAIILLFAHWLGDYVFQSNEMATHKPTSVKWLSIHVAVYCIPLFVAAALMFTVKGALIYFAINGTVHWITDFVSSRLSSRYRSNTRVFYIIIGFDQFFHTACLLATVDVANNLI